MKIVVTGAAGYVGAILTGHLLASGMQVIAVDKLIYGGEALLPFYGHSHFHLVKGDIRNRAMLMEALSGADGIVHLAAVVGEAACSVDERAAWSINRDGTEEVLAAARERGVPKLVFVSTCSNYGVSATNVLVDEESPLQPLSQYAKSKVEAERLILSGAGAACSWVLRLGTICGLSGRMRFDLLVSEMARAAALGEKIRIFSPDAWRPFLHVRDAARAVECCLRSSPSDLGEKVFNVVGENYQKRGLVDLVLKYYPGAAIEIADGQPDLRDYRVSSDRIRREIGFTAAHTVEEAFCETSAAVAAGVFRDPHWRGHSAVPERVSLLQ